MRKVFTLILVTLALLSEKSFSQANILNPADPDVIFTSTNQPAAPSYGPMAKWGHTNRLSWNPYSYGFKSYFYKGMAFRLKFPKSYQHNVNDGKKYPVFVFLHGLGEPGPIYDNEFHLIHGGQLHAQNVDNGTFDGFLFYPQSSSGYLQNYGPFINEMIDSMAKYVKADVDRVILSGLSSGGQASFDICESFPKTYAALDPISAARDEFIPKFPDIVTIPIWISNGGQDASPTKEGVITVINAFKTLGGNIKQSFFPDGGHGIWNNFWAEPGYFQSLAAAHKANPLVYFQRNNFCPTEPTSAKMGLQAGFFSYEWSKDGVTIPGATSNIYTATEYGTYRGRFKRKSTSNWSDWSPIPVVVGQKAATITPPITINGMKSNVLPAPDGSTTVPLFVPDTYQSYEWRRVSDNALVSTSASFNAAPGVYKLKVTEFFGCTSTFGNNYTVVAANGTNVPDKASNLSAITASNSQINLNWNDNPSPLYNETMFEVYRSTTQGTGYKLIAKVGADILTYSDNGLDPAKRYYYIVRSVNDNGAGPISSEASAITKSDTQAPTAPGNLRVTSTTRSSVSLKWDASTDDIGVERYEVYVNGVKNYVTTGTTFTVNNLTSLQTYAFYIKAKDATGNLSPASAQVSATAALSGLSYKYYTGTWTVLPDFRQLTPVAEGTMPNVAITPRTVNDNFGFLWEGFIKIPVTGSYTFETNSDDGSRLWINTPYNATSGYLVNNDGLHGGQYRSGTITLAAGVYPISVAFFEATGGEAMNIYWTSAAAGISTRTVIPNSAFSDNVVPAGTAPAAPSNLRVISNSYNQLTVNWTDNSNNETGFEILRSTSYNGTFIPVATVNANATSYIDAIGLNPSTKYFYKVRAINVYGASAYVNNVRADWGFNNNANDDSGNGLTLTPVGSPTYSNDKVEGPRSLSLDGTSQYMNLAFSSGSAFPSDGYTTRTVGVWLKPTATTISSANKIVFDMGGSSGGLALRFNSGALQVAAMNNVSTSTASASNITANANWVNNGWNHVAVVYNVNSLRLYVNGVQVASSAPGFSSIPSNSSTSTIGYTNSNAFSSSSTSAFYGGLMDNFTIINEALDATAVQALMNDTYGSATTAALPAVPNVPSNLNAQALSSTNVKLTWNDNSNNETLFQVERSVANTSNFRLLAEVAANNTAQVTFLDSNLFSNTNYYYRVRAVGVGGNSSYTAQATAKTLNNKPVVAPISNFTMRYGSVVDLGVSASDIDGENLTITTKDPLPAFASLSAISNGLSNINFAPSFADQGLYTISVIAADGNGGKDTVTFTLNVNANYVPQIDPVAPVTMNEGTVNTISLSANDADGNASLTYALVNPPSFVSLTDNGNGLASLSLQPGFAAAGTYNIKVAVSDGNGGVGNATIAVTVNDVAPGVEIVQMSMKYDSPDAPAPWNTIQSISTNNLKNTTGQTTTVGIDFLGTNWNAGNAGAVTYNNSGVYPDAVIKDYFWFGIYGAPETVTFNLKGLMPNAKYNLTLFGSSAWSGVPNNGTTIYTFNGVSKSLLCHNNSQNTVTFTNISANASGIIPVTMSKEAGTPYGMVNAIVLEKPYDDQTAPVLPTNLTGEALANGYVKLTWNDVAYNESRYLVKRALSAAGPFTTLNPGATNANETSYIDANVNSNVTYYYKIEATNDYGTSGETNVVSVLTINKAPVLPVIADLSMKGGTTASININATDDGSDIMTVSAQNLPSFATLQNISNGVAKINLAPTVSDLGEYKNVIVTVQDNSGASISDTFTITVTDPNVRTVYINFGPEGGQAQPSPWNNFMGYPFANYSYTGLKDDNNQATTFSFRYLTQWTGGVNLGMITGNNSGVYPDNVILSSVYTTNNGNQTLQFDGLDPAKRYNFSFLNSFNSGNPNVVTYTNGAQTVSVDGKYNSNKLGNINGVTPNASGSIQIVLSKAAAATFLMMNAVVIQEYLASTPIVRPENLFAEPILKTDQVQLTWSDKSSNETAFQIWRANSLNGSYVQIATTAVGVTTYTNTGLTANTPYYYKVRAVNGAIQSAYSNVAKVLIAEKVVLINLNVDAAQNAASPWNNTNSPSAEGTVFSKLIDNTLINSGFEMTITKELNGAGFAGVNAAGVFPANVMVSNYWTDAGQLSQLKFSNLNLTKKYRIGIFGSNTNVQSAVGKYTINGKSVILNSYFNSTKVVYINNITPDEAGNIFLDATTLTGSPYSFTGAFTIEYFDDNTTDNLNARSGNSQPTVETPIATVIDEHRADVKSITVSEEATINVYPNPFTDRVKVELNKTSASSVTLMIYDLNAKLVYRSAALNTMPGKNVLEVNIPSGRTLAPGNYVIYVMIDGKVSKSVKLIKVN